MYIFPEKTPRTTKIINYAAKIINIYPVYSLMKELPNTSLQWYSIKILSRSGYHRSSCHRRRCKTQEIDHWKNPKKISKCFIKIVKRQSDFGWDLNYHGWCWEWDPLSFSRPDWNSRFLLRNKKGASKWSNQDNRMEWLIVTSNWDWPWPEAPFFECFWARIWIQVQVFEGLITMARQVLPFSLLKTSMPLIVAETATHFPVSIKKTRALDQ